MDIIKSVYNGAKKFINGIKNGIKKVIKTIKFFTTTIGTIVGWILFVIFAGILLYAIVKAGIRALDNLFGEDWNYSTYEEDLTFIKELYNSGYESVISAQNFQDFKAFEYAVLMDAAEYIRNNPKAISTLPVGSITYQGKLADLPNAQDALDDLVALGATSRSVKVEDHYDINADVESNNDRATKPLLVYEFKISTSGQSGDMAIEEGSGNTTDELLKTGILKGSLEPYIYIIRDDIIFNYWFYNGPENKTRVIEFSPELNAYNATLNFGREMSNVVSKLDTAGSGIVLHPDQTYDEIVYYTDNTSSVPMKIPLRTLLGRYLPKAELLQAWAILKQDIDAPEKDKDDIVDELLASIKGVYNEACLLEENPTTIEKTNESGETFYYSDRDLDKSTFVTFSTAGIETTQYGINGFSKFENGDKTTATLVTDFVSAVLLTKDVSVRYTTENPNLMVINPETGIEEPTIEDHYTTISRETLATLVSSITAGGYLPAGEELDGGGYSPPSAVTSLVEGYYFLGKTEADFETIENSIKAAINRHLRGVDNLTIITRNFLEYQPIFITEDINITEKLKVDHHRMSVLLIDSATTWARKINYSHNLTQNKFEPENKYYIIPSCASSMGLERFSTTLNSDNTYRGKAYRDIFARMKEKDVINTLMQLEYSAIEGSNDCYEYMRDVYKLLETAKEYSKAHPSLKASENIHENTYTYVYIPDSVLKYDDTQTQKIYWLNLFSTGEGDEASREELENMKTKDAELTWQVVEYEKYPECNEDGKTKVYALSPFGSAYTRTYFQSVFELKGFDGVTGEYEPGGHSGSDWGGRNRVGDILNKESGTGSASSIGKKIYEYELNRLSSIYDSETAEKKLKTELRETTVNNPIVAVAPGRVEKVTFEARAGFMVKIVHSEGGSSGKITTDYLHMKRWPLVNEGDYVGAGTLLGYEGNTGRSFGQHLHFEINDGYINPYETVFPSFNPFYYEDKAKEEGYKIGSEYMSLYRTVSMVDVDGGTPAKVYNSEELTNQHPKNALVENFEDLIQKQGEMDRDVIIAGALGWNDTCDYSKEFIKYLEKEEYYDLFNKEEFFDKELAKQKGYLDIPPELYAAMYGDICVNTTMPGCLPPLTKQELEQILNAWLPSRYNAAEVKWLKENVFTDKTISAIIDAQDTYNVSPIFMLAVATLEQQMGISYYRNNDHILGKPGIYNIFSIKGGKISDGTAVEYQSEGTYWRKYDSYGHAFERFSHLIAEGDYYFTQGKYTIAAIGPTYCPTGNPPGSKWCNDVTSIVFEIMQYYTGSWSSLPFSILVGNFGSNQELMNAIKNCKAYYAAHDFKYCQGSAGRLIPPYSGTPSPVDGFSKLPVRQTKHVCDDCRKNHKKPAYRTDCSTYVSWVIYEYAMANNMEDLYELFDSQQSSGSFETIANKLKNGAKTGAYQYMTLVWHRDRAGDSESKARSIVQEGDILIYREGSTHHVDFSSGKWGKVYSCGGNSGISAGENPTSGYSTAKLTAIIRLR